MNFNSKDIPCLDSKQVSEEMFKCVENPAFLRAEICLNEAYERPRTYQWSDLKNKIPFKRREKIDEAVTKELEVLSSKDKPPSIFRLTELPSQSSEYWASKKGKI